jgi:hypothetical protein
VEFDGVRIEGTGTPAVEAGIAHRKIVSEQLGQAKVSITRDVDSHASATLQRRRRRSSPPWSTAAPHDGERS